MLHWPNFGKCMQNHPPPPRHQYEQNLPIMKVHTFIKLAKHESINYLHITASKYGFLSRWKTMFLQPRKAAMQHLGGFRCHSFVGFESVGYDLGSHMFVKWHILRHAEEHTRRQLWNNQRNQCLSWLCAIMHTFEATLFWGYIILRVMKLMFLHLGLPLCKLVK